MENSFQTSFIPKKPITTSSSVVRNTSRSFFGIISVIILIVVGISSVGLFFYKSYLVGQKKVSSDSLLKVRDSFEKDTIDELELYDKRVLASKQVLNNHIVLSPLFSLIGNLTIPEVQYTKFDHVTTDKGFFVKISGIASDYRSIALQADALNTSKGRSFKNVVFSNLTKNKDNRVGFDLEFSVDPALLSYEKNVLLEDSPSKKVETSEVAPTQTSLPVDKTVDQLETPVNNQTQ